MAWEAVPPEIRAKLDRLTPAQREAVRLREEGHGVRTIARILGLNPTSIRDRLNGAYRRLEEP
jgi:DNA-directed RNA polymerase specialized sigma24 family protein